MKSHEPKYCIRNQTLRRIFRGVSFSLTPKSEAEETMVSGFLDRLAKIVNDYARKTAKRAINKIGRD